tara:strand:+ start:201 stop:485 length:285 start_codon:yes stop_codon:yes gene_type:complete
MEMKITLHEHEIDEAVEDYLQKKGLASSSLAGKITEVTFTYQEREYVYETHKNGKRKKDKTGCSIIDWHASKYVDKIVCPEMNLELSFYLGEAT